MKKVKAHTKYTFLSFACLTSLLLNSPLSSAASLYNIIDIGILNLQSNDDQNLQIKINNNNEVVGWHRSGNKKIGFTWNITDGFNNHDTITLENAFSNKNDTNFTTGFITNTDGTQTAIMWNATYNNTTVLGNLGGNLSQANSINSTNQIVGNSHDINGIAQPFIWSSGSISIIPINSAQGGTADAINDNEWVAGSTYAGQYAQAYLWDKTNISILNTTNADVHTSWVSDINNLNQIVGGMQIFHIANSTSPKDLRTRAFRWSKINGLEDLGKNIQGISWANATNGNEQVVGGRYLALMNREAILWESTSAFNLNTITVNKNNWTLTNATDINTFGNIVGIGKRAGLFHAFLLEPSGGSVTASDLEINFTSGNTNNKARAISSESTPTLKFTIINHGPSDANNIVAESTLDNLLSISNLNISKGNCTTENKQITCEISSLLVNESIELSLDLDAEETKDYQISAQVKADEIDTGINPNNIISKNIKITAKTATQESAQPDQNQPGDSENTDNDTQKVSTAGCSMSKNTPFDPIFILLCFVAFLKIARVSAITKH